MASILSHVPLKNVFCSCPSLVNTIYVKLFHNIVQYLLF